MIADILPKLEKVKAGRGQGQWLACCPAHSDNDPSLALKELPDGMVMLHCWSGCDTKSIVNAIGLDMRSLYPEPEPLQGFNVKPAMPSWRRKQFVDLYKFERLIANIFRSDVRNNRFKVKDLDRFFLACERIRKAGAVLHG
jgi:hypothetical protein